VKEIMKPSARSLKKWRKKTPATARSYAEKRNRQHKHVIDMMKEYTRRET